MSAPENLKNIVEAALLAAGRPLSLDTLIDLFPEIERPDRKSLRGILATLGDEYRGRGIEIREVASGWRIQVGETCSPWVSRLWDERPQRYSRALMETLALIAYRQPITRGDIEEIRGVAVSSHIIKTLLEREWIRVVGQRDVPGKPSLYATTREFLDYFSLRTLDDLPTLAQIRDLDEINRELDLNDPDKAGAAAADAAAEPGAEPSGAEPSGADGDAVTAGRETAGQEAVEPAGQIESEQDRAPTPDPPHATAPRDPDEDPAGSPDAADRKPGPGAGHGIAGPAGPAAATNTLAGPATLRRQDETDG